ncbi:MAG: hypothetical protein AAFX99_08990, partial [Myxococcota bacterium]
MSLILALAVSIMLPACGGSSDEESSSGTTANNTTTDGGSSTATTGPDCTEGFLGCSCIAGTACWPNSGWVCLDGLCAEPTCEVGTLGCACFSNNSCDRDDNGDLYVCNSGGICEESSCPVGTQGCACDGGICDDGLACVDAMCDRLGCTAGDNGCACLAGDTCNGELVCLNNACTTAPGCELGADGCLCRPGAICDDGLICNEGACEAIDNCPTGGLGCACDNGGCIDTDHYCDPNDRCQAIDCPEGEEGCACSVDDVCGFDGAGNALVCETGICRSESCMPGQPGCACINGYGCTEGTQCDDEVGLCRPTDCYPGAEYCACAGGGCGQGLVCLNTIICADNTGHVGGTCLENGLCNRGANCLNDVCQPCLLGRQGCGCDNEGGCVAGLACIAGNCVAQTALDREAPTDPFCVTPCSSDYISSDGTIVQCNTDGLLEDFCPSGKTCIEGSCVGLGQEPRTCLVNTDCPEYQSCLNGQCYSECKVHEDCATIDPSMVCETYTCRFPCTDADPCPVGMTCNLTEGATNGVCIDLITPDETIEPVNVVEANFGLNTVSVSMTNVNVTGSFQITNNSAVTQRFQIMKMSDAVYSQDAEVERSRRQLDGTIDCSLEEREDCTCTGNDQCGDGFVCRLGACRPQACPAGGCPMFWLEFNELQEDPVRAQEFEVTIEAGRSKTVMLTNSNGSSGVRWSGELEVSNSNLGAQRIQLDYHELPEGQWSGNLYYFASFGTKGLTPEDSECILPGTDLPRILCSENNPCGQGQTCVNGQCADSCTGDVEQSTCSGELVCVKGGCCQRNAWLLKDNPTPGSGADTWSETRDDSEIQGRIGNALVQRWAAFRRGVITWDEFMAVLTATRTGSWDYANVKE